MFIINNDITFEPEQRRLSFQDKSVSLTENMSRCLLVLLLNKGHVVSKQTLLREVWERNGVIVTETSIRQTLSQLRKSFISLGISYDVIITFPRQGYKIATVSCPGPSPLAEQNDQVTMSETETVRITEGATSAVCVAEKVNVQAKKKRGSLWWLYCALIFTSVLSIGIFCYIKFFFVSQIHYSLVSENSVRRLWVPDTMKGNESQILKAMDTFDQYIQRGIIDPPAVYDVYVNRTIKQDNYSFFVCNRKSNQERECESVYIYKRSSS
ncbi:winged helix-turn-helix domain-containing protein [Pantoea sp. SORGH_AS_0659]|uniref:transcriptional regulator n=1 Tax=Pantoea sp. SORGH_AS_0659 TaxID=3062597 RepID=UPI0028675398|nr:winged helix-turn-helix domain-containing protein [Pantoea sp. SORGH_AS_0659]MDR6352499.1 DNA-binding winged helix-turn-helix (wHTH) protein [Pantoea sp. SORGH_AS_0659]